MMKTLGQSLVPVVLFACGAGALNAASVVVSDLGGLGTPDEVLSSAQSYGTYNNRTVNGITTVDVKDATFALDVDFTTSTSSSNHVLWETGGGTVGFSLVYVPNVSTLTLRQVSNTGTVILRVDRLITLAERNAGDLELVWTYDADGGGATIPQVELYVDRVSAGTDTDASSQNDWSGTDGAGLGQRGGNGLAAGGGNTNLGSDAPFSSTEGSINFTKGLRFWGDTHAVIPEPSTGALVGAAVGLALLRRRRGDSNR